MIWGPGNFRKMWPLLFQLIGLVTLDPNQMLSYRKHVDQDWRDHLYLDVDFLLLQSINLSLHKILNNKIEEEEKTYSLPTGGYECHKGWCTKKLSSVQTFCQWSNASQRLKGNQLLWDHSLLFKPWNNSWKNIKYIFYIDFQEWSFI